MMYIRMSCPLGQGCQCASLINPGNGIIDDLAALVIPRSLSVQTLSASSFWMIERGTSSLLVWGGQHHAPKRLTCEMPQMFFSECNRMSSMPLPIKTMAKIPYPFSSISFLESSQLGPPLNILLCSVCDTLG